MPFFRPLFLFITLLQTTCFSLFAQGNKQSVQNWNAKQPSRFTENKGQVTDQNGNFRNDVKYIYYAPGFKAIFKANSFSYEVFTVEKKLKEQQISEATGKGLDENLMPNKFKKPENVTIKSSRIDIELPGANKNPQIIAEGKSSDYNNYYLAHTPEEGVQKVYSFSKLTYKNIWPNIDIVFYAKKEGELKYDIVVNPGGNLTDIQFTYSGIQSLKLNYGKLQVKIKIGFIEEAVPFSYIAESNNSVTINYHLSKNKITFKGKYNYKQTLIIDPKISWATYYTGNSTDVFYAIVADKSGNTYAAGTTHSYTGIATSGAYQTTFNYGYAYFDAFVVKFSRSGKRLWASYYGGERTDMANSLAVDDSGDVYMLGLTMSPVGIATKNAHQPELANKVESDFDFDAFLVKFSGSGIRQWGTYYGGIGYDNGLNIIIDHNCNIFFAGETDSKNNIATSKTHQDSLNGYHNDAFLVKFSCNGDRQWGTYYGGKRYDHGKSLAVDEDGNIYMSGGTTSNTNIATPGAHQPIQAYNGNKSDDVLLNEMYDAFLSKFDSNGKMIWGTYYGGYNADVANALIYDNSGFLYMAGSTFSQTGIATNGAFKTSYSDSDEVFLVKFDTLGKRLWGTYFGDLGGDFISGLEQSEDGIIYLAGYTSSNNISTKGAYQEKFNNGYRTYDYLNYDVYLAAFGTDGKRKWCTYYGGNKGDWCNALALDKFNNIYLAGTTASHSGIATKNAYQKEYIVDSLADTFAVTSDNAFIVKFSNAKPDAGIISIDSIQQSYCGESSDSVYVQLKNYSFDLDLDSVRIAWSINEITEQTGFHKVLLRTQDTTASINIGKISFPNGRSILKIWTYLPDNSTDAKTLNDTFIKEITVHYIPVAGFQRDSSCAGNMLDFINTSSVQQDSIVTYTWNFGDGDTSHQINPSHIYDNTGIYIVMLTATSSRGCLNSFVDTIKIYPLPQTIFNVNDICVTDSAFFINSSLADYWYWDFGDSIISTDRNPKHKYFSPGIYMVKLVTRNKTGCADSIIQPLNVFQIPKADFYAVNMCVSDSLVIIDSSLNISQWLWDFGDGNTSILHNPTHKYATGGNYNIKLIGSNGGGCTDTFSRLIFVDSTCVWPGDGNNDKIADNSDILTIGLAYGDSGISRVDTSTIWKGNIVPDWSKSFISGINHKSADCNGDGIIDNNDTLAVSINYGKKHGKKYDRNRGKNTDPLLKIVIQNDSIKAGDTLTAYILFGEYTLLAEDVYGIAFSLFYNKQYFLPNPVVDFNGWLGSSGKDIIGYFNNNEMMDLAITRINHENKTGYGKLATIKIILKDTFINTENLSLELLENKVISANEKNIPINIEGDSVTVFNEPDNTGKEWQVMVNPNPFITKTTIEYNLPTQSTVKILIYDINGRIQTLMPATFLLSGKHQFIVDDKFKMSKGLYLIKVEINGVPTFRKMVKLD